MECTNDKGKSIMPALNSQHWKKRKRVEIGIQQLRRQAHMEVRGSDEPFFYPLETQARTTTTLPLEQRRCHSPWRQIEISNLQFHFLFSILVRFVPAPVFSWLSALP